MKKIFIIILCLILTFSYLSLNNLSPSELDEDNTKGTDLSGTSAPEKSDKTYSSNYNSVYIVYHRYPTDSDEIFLSELGIEIVYKSKYLNVIQTGPVDDLQLEEILNLHTVQSIEPVPEIRPLLDVSAGAVKARESIEYSPETAWELGYSGDGIVIAIVDTGIDDNHPSLANKFIAGVDFADAPGIITPKDGSFNPDDESGHGTPVAGIALGTGGDDGIYSGIAPSARLIDVKTVGNIISRIMEALEWCLQNQDTDWNNNGLDEYDGIDIVSISLGGNENSDGSDPLSQLLNQMVANGIVVVTAMGNSGPNNQGVNGIPAADDVISVGNLDIHETVDRSDDEIHSTSTRGPREDDGDEDRYDELKPDVVAPGIDITAPSYSRIGQRGNGYGAASGASYACPHVSGICALMLEANPNLRPREIRNILHETAESRGNPDLPMLSDKYNYDYGYGIVDAYSAVSEALGYQSVNLPPVIKSVTASPQFVRPNEDSTIETVASDSDGDPMIYEYSITGGTITGVGSIVTWTAPTELGEYQITVTVNDGIDSSNPVTISVFVEENPSNHPPEIQSVSAEPNTVAPGETSAINVSATDIDGDTLFYSYKPSAGTIIGTGPAVSWLAPESNGKHKIEITVSDGDLTVQTQVQIIVEGGVPNKPPEIESFTADSNLVEINGKARLQVIAHDPENGKLSYLYFASVGEIKGTGATVDYIAPSSPEIVEIDVMVTDEFGLSDEKDVKIEVFQPNEQPEIKEARANPSSVKNDGKSEVLFTVRVTDVNGVEDINRVELDLTSVFGSANQKMYDNGKFGDVKKYDGVYSYTFLVPQGISGGRKNIRVLATDFNSDPVSESVSINITAVSPDKDDKGVFEGIPGFESNIVILAFLVAMIIMIKVKDRKHRSGKTK
jgi:serine protease AprX